MVFIFLQGWRATLIPALAVPVSLIGTFALFPLLGFSINTLALIGLVLAIGLVVDDAIVVVEAVEHHIDQGLSPKDATIKAMEEVSGPVVAIALVLSAVFLPTIFIPGITGRLYQQFAVTIAISVLISAFNALTLSPALSALILKPKKESRGLLGRFYPLVQRRLRPHHQRLCQMVRGLYQKGGHEPALSGPGNGGHRPPGGQATRRFPAGRGPGLYVCRGAVARRLLPATHQCGLPPDRSDHGEHPRGGVHHLGDWLQHALRRHQHVQRLFLRDPKALGRAAKAGGEIRGHHGQPQPEARPTPPGHRFCLLTAGHPGHRHCRRGHLHPGGPGRQGYQVPLGEHPEVPGGGAGNVRRLSRVTTTFIPTVPQIFVKVDRDKVLKQGVDISEVYRVLQAFMGGYFVNYFNRFGRQWQVYVQAEGEYRANAEQLGQFYVRNKNGDSVPLSALTSLEQRSGPEFTMRYNLYRAVQINAVNAPGYSSAQGMKALEEVFKDTMPGEMGYDYLGMSYQEKKAQEGVPAWIIFALSLLFVFLILAAQYESWSLPFSVLLGHAHRGLRGLRGNLHAQYGAQSLCPNRSGYADRPRREKRHPHRRVCQG